MDKHNPIFQKYDYGHHKNKQVYGQKHPPVYDLSKIKIPVKGLVGEQDKFGDVTDNSMLKDELLSQGVDYEQFLYD